MTQLISRTYLLQKYGKPNSTGKGYITIINLPYPMRLNWNSSVYVTRMSCHKLIASRLLAVFIEILDCYGLEKIKEYQLDDFGGCFNYRLSRNSKLLSFHAWGLAIDLDPDRNLLHETSATARFARPEYKPMIDIFYKYGFINLGVEKNRDWMHFQINI